MPGSVKKCINNGTCMSKKYQDKGNNQDLPNNPAEL